VYSLLRQANLILLRILRLARRLCWGLGIAGGGILRNEPWYRENDQENKRIHLASKTLAMMHEPESLHCCRQRARKYKLMSWLVLEHFSPCYILLTGAAREKEDETR